MIGTARRRFSGARGRPRQKRNSSPLIPFCQREERRPLVVHRFSRALFRGTLRSLWKRVRQTSEERSVSRASSSLDQLVPRGSAFRIVRRLRKERTPDLLSFTQSAAASSPAKCDHFPEIEPRSARPISWSAPKRTPRSDTWTRAVSECSGRASSMSFMI